MTISRQSGSGGRATSNTPRRARASLIMPGVFSAASLPAAVSLLLVAAAAQAGSLSSCTDPAIVVFDASGSMESSRHFKRRIDIARQAVDDVLPNIAHSRPTGLVTYSGNARSDCRDIALRVAPALKTGPKISGELSRLEPNGPTALTAAVELAARTLEELAQSGLVVVISDGHETCGQDICRLAREISGWKARIEVHTIGFNFEGPGTEELLCLSEATNGTHATAGDFEALTTALRRALSCPYFAERSTPAE